MDSVGQAVDCGNCALDVRCLNRLVPGVMESEEVNKVMVSYQKGEILCKVG